MPPIIILFKKESFFTLARLNFTSALEQKSAKSLSPTGIRYMDLVHQIMILETPPLPDWQESNKNARPIEIDNSLIIQIVMAFDLDRIPVAAGYFPGNRKISFQIIGIIDSFVNCLEG